LSQLDSIFTRYSIFLVAIQVLAGTCSPLAQLACVRLGDAPE